MILCLLFCWKCIVCILPFFLEREIFLNGISWLIDWLVVFCCWPLMLRIWWNYYYDCMFDFAFGRNLTTKCCWLKGANATTTFTQKIPHSSHTSSYLLWPINNQYKYANNSTIIFLLYLLSTTFCFYFNSFYLNQYQQQQIIMLK